MARQKFPEIEDLDRLRSVMASAGATRLLIKKLSPNDNSKNQVYLGGNFETLNLLPYKDVYADDSKKGSKRDRFKADLFLGWIGGNGDISEAPNAQLILYPKYPEVRLSGFLAGCEFAPSEMMQSRLEGRLLFLGIRNDGMILGHVTGPTNPIKKQLEAQKNLETLGVFLKLPVEKVKTLDTRGQLVKALCRRLAEATAGFDHKGRYP